MDTIKIGSFIKELRKEKGMTQKDLADALYITDRAVSKWERGLSAPDISLLEPLAEILEVNISELITGKREETGLCTDASAVTKEFITYSDNEITKKVIQRKKTAYFKIFSVFLGIIAVYLTIVQFGGDGFAWSCIPAHISLEKAVNAVKNYNRREIEKSIYNSSNMYNQLVLLQDSGIEIIDRKTYLFDTKLDDGFLFTTTYFTVDYNDFRYIFTCTGTYRNGKTEFMYLMPGASTNTEFSWVLTLGDALCTYNPG